MLSYRGMDIQARNEHLIYHQVQRRHQALYGWFSPLIFAIYVASFGWRLLLICTILDTIVTTCIPLSLSFFLSLRNVGVGTSCSSQPSPKSGFLYVNVIHVWNLICSFAIQYQMVWILQQVQLALKFWFLINATQDRCTFYAIIDQSKIPSAQVLVLMNNTTSTIYLF